MANRGVNKVILIGNVGQEPDIRFLPSGKPVANLRMATSDSWTDRQSGQRQERTEWHTLVAFDGRAEVVQKFVQKGSRLYIEGKLQTRKWQGQDGVDRYSTEIVVGDIQLLSNGRQQPAQQPGGQQQAQGQGSSSQQGYATQQSQENPAASQPQANQSQNQNSGPAPVPVGASQSGDEWSDEMPF